MKFRDDFVTNSSATSFCICIKIGINDKKYSMESSEYCCEDNGEIIAHKSPLALGQCETIDEMINMLKSSVKVNGRAYLSERSLLIKNIRKNASDMSDISDIEITGTTFSRDGKGFDETYKYDLKENKCFWSDEADEYEFEGREGSGGELSFEDLSWDQKRDGFNKIECKVIERKHVEKTANEKSSPVSVTGNSLSGKTFVVTGDLVNYTRDGFKSFVETHGGRVTGSVSKKTNYVVTNEPDSGTTKLAKAKELGIPVISEEEFMKMI